MKWLKRLAKSFVQDKIDQVKDWNDPDRSEAPQMPCPEMNIPMSHDLHAKLLTEAEDAGMEFNGTRAAHKGCTFDFNYDTEAEILHVTPDHLPWLFSCSEVESHINQLIEKAKGAL